MHCGKQYRAECALLYTTHCRNSTRRITISVFTHNPHISFFTNPSNISRDFCALCTYFNTFKSSLQSTAYDIFKVKYSKWYFQYLYIDTYYMLFLEECKVIFKYNPLTNWRWTRRPLHSFGSAAVRQSSSFINQTSFSSCCSQQPSPQFKSRMVWDRSVKWTNILTCFLISISRSSLLYIAQNIEKGKNNIQVIQYVLSWNEYTSSAAALGNRAGGLSAPLSRTRPRPPNILYLSTRMQTQTHFTVFWEEQFIMHRNNAFWVWYATIQKLRVSKI